MSEQSLENMESIFYAMFFYFSVDAFSCYEEFRKLFFHSLINNWF